jgi:formamidopyrimidine-DNA glycosylase
VATTSRRFARVLRGAGFLELARRGKHLLFSLKPAGSTFYCPSCQRR